jgi:8-oxo-dGTP pyrophosphatase MutT (NUDIX family)
MSDPTPAEPDYACAIITAPNGRRLLQLRPLDARHAAGQLTCFGGAREPQESAETCLRRELHEELGWTPVAMQPACDLRRGSQFIARFFYCPMTKLATLTTEPGHQAVWVPTDALPGLPLSPWHRAVLAAVDRGESVVELPA